MILYYSIKNHILVSWMGTAMMSRYVVEKRERRSRVVGTLCREAVRNRLIWEAYTATWGHAMWYRGLHCHLGPCLGPWPYHRWDWRWCPWPPKTIQMTVVWAATWGHVDVWGSNAVGVVTLGCPVLPPVVMEMFGPELQSWVRSGSVTQLQAKSVMLSIAHVTTECHGDAWGL